MLSQKIFALGKELVGTDGEVKGYSRVMKFLHLWCLKFCHSARYVWFYWAQYLLAAYLTLHHETLKFTGAISSACQKCARRYHTFTTTCTPGLESLLHLFKEKAHSLYI